MMEHADSFALYRLPHRQECHALFGTPVALDSPLQLSGREGFVIAPFVMSDEAPLLLLCPGEVLSFGSVAMIPEEIREAVNRCNRETIEPDAEAAPDRDSYAHDFQRFHAEIRRGRFSKIVLARRASAIAQQSLFQLFASACERYPRMFISLFSTPQSGTWLVATPEVLLEGQGERWHTMALAGTMRLTGDALRFDEPIGSRQTMMWSEKNIQEQRYVATYIGAALRAFASDVREDGPCTVRAGALVHLRSDFSFSMAEGEVGRLIDSLHPTPAVCGLPKDEAQRFIVENEHSPREYYSGFAGPQGLQGETHLYVSLRCMKLRGTACQLFAGGGLLPDSDERAEWDETEAKMMTMKEICSATKKI